MKRDLEALRKEKEKFLNHCLLGADRVSYNDVHYSLELTDATLFENVKTRGSDEEDDNSHEECLLSMCTTEEEKNFVRQKKDFGRCFDLAEVRNELRGYLVDSYYDGCISREALNYVAKWFNRFEEEIRFGPTIDEYWRLCKKQLYKVLTFAYPDDVMTDGQIQDIKKRVEGVRKNIFKRDKEKLFGGDESD